MRFDLTGPLTIQNFKADLAGGEDLRPSELHACLLYAAYLMHGQEKQINKLRNEIYRLSAAETDRYPGGANQ